MQKSKAFLYSASHKSKSMSRPTATKWLPDAYASSPMAMRMAVMP